MPNTLDPPQSLDPSVSRDEVDDADDLWIPIDEDGDVDTTWFVFHYDDGAIRFINRETEHSVWRGRTVVGFDDGDARVESHYSKPLDLIILVAASNVSMPPVAGTLVNPDDLPFDFSELGEDEIKLGLRVLLAQWIRKEQGQSWQFDVDAPTATVFINELSEAGVDLDSAEEKHTDERTLTEEFAATLHGEIKG